MPLNQDGFVVANDLLCNWLILHIRSGASQLETIKFYQFYLHHLPQKNLSCIIYDQ